MRLDPYVMFVAMHFDFLQKSKKFQRFFGGISDFTLTPTPSFAMI